MKRGTHNDLVAALSPDEAAKALQATSEDDALVRIGLEVTRGLHSGNLEDAVFWLVVFARWRGIKPSERVRSLLEGFLGEVSGTSDFESARGYSKSAETAVHEIDSAVTAERMAEVLMRQPADDARTAIAVELVRALAAERVGDCFFWLLVFARLVQAAPSERVRSEVDAYMRAFSH